MAHRYPLKTRFTLRILPRNIQHVRVGFAGDDLQPLHLIARIVDRLAINPRSMRQHRAVLWMYGLYSVEFYVGLRRPAVRSLQIFQKNSQNLDRPERLLSCVLQLEENPWFRIYESKSKRFFVNVICAHKFSSEFRASCYPPAAAGGTDLNGLH